MNARMIGSVVLCGLLGSACARKTPAAAASAEAVAKLPDGAKSYFEANVKEALAVEAIRSIVEPELRKVPPPCAAVVEATERLAVAGYGEAGDAFFLLSRPRPEAEDEPSGGEAPTAPALSIVAILVGPSAEVVRGCFEAVARDVGEPIETETRDGREILVVRDYRLAVFAVSDTLHVIAGPDMLDAALAAASGGESLGGASILAELSHVPRGTVVAAMEMSGEMKDRVAMLPGREGPPPAPRAVAISIAAGDPLKIHGAAVMDDEAGARAMHDVMKAGLDMAKGAVALTAGRDGEASEMETTVRGVLDSVSLGRNGNVVTAGMSVGMSVLPIVWREASAGAEPAVGLPELDSPAGPSPPPTPDRKPAVGLPRLDSPEPMDESGEPVER